MSLRRALTLVMLLVLGGVARAEPPSVSMGNASDGYLMNGRSMPLKGPHHRVLDATRSRGFCWGTAELVDALQRAAASVAAAHPGSVLLIGNMSRNGGGDIPTSVSHNSGRDADIPFYAADKRGRSIREHGFVAFDGRGRSGSMRFDVRRNWAFVKALLTDSRIQVQWLFLSNPLRALLLEHARSISEPADLIRRAEVALGQPGNSSAHAEHFHVRLYCALAERLLGCLDYGTQHAHADDYAAEVLAKTRELASGLMHLPEADAVAAIERIGAIRGHSAVPALGQALESPHATVRLAAARALRLLRGAQAARPALEKALDASRAPDWTHELVTTLAHIADEASAPALVRVFESPARVRDDTRAMAANGLAHLFYQPAVPVLARGLIARSRPVRQAARQALLLLTNRSLGRGKRALRRWTVWYAAHRTEPRLTWIKAGFARKGIHTRTPKQRKRAIPKLLRFIREGGALGHNARVLIRDLTGYWVERGHYSDMQLYRFYKTWTRSR